VVTSDPNKILELVSNRKVYVFGKSDFEALNRKIADAAADPLHPDLMKEMQTAALEMEGEKEGNFFSVGYYGTARNDRPDDISKLTPAFACHWLCEIVNVVHGCDYEFRRMSVE